MAKRLVSYKVILFRQHGYGELNTATHGYYKGTWKNGHKHGKANELTETGERYIGDYFYMVTEEGQVSQRHGKGKIIYEIGGTESYEGEWDSDKFHGQGIARYRSGSYFEGTFYKGKKQGRGTLTYKNLTTLTGDWNNGVLEGFATSTTGMEDDRTHEIDGRKYKEVQARGIYRETIRNGKFRIYFQDTKYLDCVYDNGVKNGIGYLHLTPKKYLKISFNNDIVIEIEEIQASRMPLLCTPFNIILESNKEGGNLPHTHPYRLQRP